jgi:uncharacterized membrane protein
MDFTLSTPRTPQESRDRFSTYILGIFFGSALLILGLFFRFANLDRRMYWHDEALTSLRASGYLRAEILPLLYDGAEISVQSLLDYQRPGPGKNLLDTLNAAVTDAPLHPPLYYLLSRFWMDIVGHSPQAMRSLAAVISILALPGMYWLTLELFGNHRTVVFATALIWVSPIQVLFAREARQYSLWVVATLFASASLLYALRVQSKSSWVLFFVSTTIGIYTHLFYGFVALAHGFYVVIIVWLRTGRRILFDKSFLGYFFSSLVGLLAFTPWLIVLMRDRSQITEAVPWASVEIPLKSYIQTLVSRYSGVFVDLYPFSVSIKLLVVLPIIALITYSFYFLWREVPTERWLFILLPSAITIISLTALDLISGGFRSVVARYLVPCFIGIQLPVAYFLARQTAVSKLWQQMFWRLALLAVFAVGILSNILIVRAETWWDKGNDFIYPQTIQVISNAEAPLVIIDGEQEVHFGYLLAFAHEFPAHVNVKWMTTTMSKIHGHYSDIFLYQAIPDSTEVLNGWQEYHIRNLIPGHLWRLTEKAHAQN